MTALESSHRAKGFYREVKVVANGHSHRMSVLHITIYVDSNRTFVSVTENCRRIKGVWMCFGGGGYVFCLMAQNLPSLDEPILLGLIPVMGNSASIAGSGSSTSRITAKPSEPTNERNTTRSWTRCPWSVMVPLSCGRGLDSGFSPESYPGPQCIITRGLCTLKVL